MIKILLILAFLLVIYFVVGQLTCRILKLDCNITLFPLIGYGVCMVLFQVIAIPLMMLKASLILVSGIYLVVFVLLVFLLIKVGQKKDKLSVRLDKTEIIVFSSMIILQWVFLFINMCYGSDWDNAQYVGEISTTLFTNSFKHFDPYTGKTLKNFVWQNCFITYEPHSAVLCNIFQIHPLIFVHRVLANIEIVFANAITYNILLVLLDGKCKKSLIALFSTVVINLYSYTLYSWSGFMFIRTGESKSMLAVVIIPLIIYWFLRMAKYQPARNLWIMLFLTTTMGLGISKSGSFLIPIVIGLEALPLILRNKRWNVIMSFIGCVLPCIVYALIMMTM